MGGIVNNADLLAALNQQVQAINDLATAIGALVLECNVDNTCAPVVTQNCTPLVTCSSFITNNVYTSGGVELDAPPGESEGEPPPGYVPANPETENRKCKVSNFLVDQIQAVVTKLDILDADKWGGLGFILSMGLLGGILGTTLGFAGTFIGGVAGAMAGMVVLLVTGGALLDFADMTTILTDHREEFVCIFYVADGSIVALQNFLGACDANGMTWVETKLVEYCLPHKLLDLLFFTIEEYEAILDGWEITTDCEECEE